MPDARLPLHAELIASGDRRAMVGGWCIFVFGCVGFMTSCAYIVYKSVHRHDTRKARWVLPAMEEPQVGLVI